MTTVVVGSGRVSDSQEAGAEGDGRRALDAKTGSWTASERCAVQPRCTTVDNDVVVKRNFGVYNL